MVRCGDCLYKKTDIRDTNIPCYTCVNGSKWVSEEHKKQEEINHPDRYNSNGYECIDVMQAIFGLEAVKNFCKLNAFKYVWRADKKGHNEDCKKAIWYLNKYIELEERGNEEKPSE